MALTPIGPEPLVTLQEQPKDEPDGFGLDRINGELLLDATAAALDLDRPVAERRPSAVPIALPGVLLHGAQHVPTP